MYQTHVDTCSSQHCSQWPNGGNSLNVHQQMTDKQHVVNPLMGCYLARKNNEVLADATIWMNRANMLHERRLAQKITHCMIPFM